MTTATPLFSVITVCFNAAGTLQATLDSLRAQRCRDFEYLVVDGGSQDGTLALLDAAADLVDRRLSEPDEGIYDAMNKGVALARGQYLYFLNADDRLADADVLADVAACLQARPAPELLYGNAIYVAADGGRSRQCYGHLGAANLVFANLCHQAVFAHRGLFARHGGFDTGYRLVADLDWLVRCLRAGAPHRWVDRDICLYAQAGLSARQRSQMVDEKKRLQQRLHGTWGAAAGRLRYRVARKLRSWWA